MAGYGQPQVNGQVMSGSGQHYQKEYQQQQYDPRYQQQPQDRSRRGRDDDDQRRRRSRSNHRSSSRARRAQQSSPDYPPENTYHQYPGGGVANNVTPPSQDAASSSNLGTPSGLDAVQRRPAYLLHRDLVIGKGSYGQVCIASRGEAEGHQSSKSGKHKKFACKCVMLRNDPKYIAKLQEEVNVLRELRGHDNVIRLFDVFCVDNELFIITELGRGGDLFHLLTTHPKHGVTEAYAG